MIHKTFYKNVLTYSQLSIILKVINRKGVVRNDEHNRTNIGEDRKIASQRETTRKGDGKTRKATKQD